MAMRRALGGLSRLAGLAALALLPAVATFAADPLTVSQENLLARIRAHDPNLLVLDVRAASEYDAGHVPGAINVPHDRVAQRIGELEPSKSRDVVAYCRTGRRSAAALATLREKGFTRLAHLQGDFEGWEAARLPVERAAR
jgi:phage shock protein E